MERADSPYMPFPFLLGYSAAVLEQEGIDVAVIDACAEKLDREAFLQRVAKEAPDVVMAEVSTPSLHEDLETIRALREDLRWKGDLILGGLHKPLYDGAFLDENPHVDATLVGEFDWSLVRWVRARERGERSTALPGILHRGPDGVIVDGGRLPSQQGLDQLPWPARHLFPMRHYHDRPGGIPAPSVQMWASRGCSFTCSFCAWPQILYADNLYRTRSAANVADEVEALLSQGYGSYYFDDDTFNLGKRRTQQLADEFRRRGFRTPWGFMGRADTCDVDQFGALVETGLQAVKFGVESADTGRLKQIGKNLDVDKVRRAVAGVKSMGVKVHLTFMFGLPGETLETMQRTLDLAYELDPDSAQFTIAVPFPGSRLHSELADQGRLTDIDWANLDGYRTGVVRTDALEAEQIVSFVHAVHRRWTSRKGTPGPAPRIPVAEIGGSNLAVALLPGPGDAAWLEEALRRVATEPGPAREIVVVAPEGAEELEAAAARACDWATFVSVPQGSSTASAANRVPNLCTSQWMMMLAPEELPPPRFLLDLLSALKGADLHSALSFPGPRRGWLCRWGALRPPEAATDGVYFAPLSGTVWSRAWLEEVGGWPEDLSADDASHEFVMRGLLLGHRATPAALPPVEGSPRQPVVGAVEAGRSWVRRWLRAAPRELLVQAAVPLVASSWERAQVFGPGGAWRFLSSVAQTVVAESDGLRQERRRVLGARRAGASAVDRWFAQSERGAAGFRATWMATRTGEGR